MDQIFHDYYDKILTGDEKLQEIYATYENQPVSWVHCDDITIKELTNRICDEFEDAGFDLDELPLENIKDKFIEFEPKIIVPEQYKSLIAAKNRVKEQFELLKNIENLVEDEHHQAILNKFSDILKEIDKQIKDLL